MSHISTFGTIIKNVQGFLDTARTLGYEVREGDGAGSTIVVKQFGTNEVTAFAGIKLPGWRYEVAVTEDGNINYDHWGSQGDSFDKLGDLIKQYNMKEVATAIPYDQIERHYYTYKENDDTVLTLEYA